MIPLEWLAALPLAVAETAAAPPAAVACALAGAFLLLAPRGVPLRAAGAALLLPLVLYRAPSPDPGEAWIDVLDVGQGLAVVVRTAGHALAYDAGPSWGAQSDGGSRVVVPHLRGEGVGRLDGLVLTHADDDHAGGAQSLAASRRPAWLLSTLPEGDERHALAPESRPCLAGTRWEWDGVAFEVLHPASGAMRDRRRGNDRSCVIRVAAPGGAAILAADIERRAEGELVAREGARLRAQVLLVPHHGSRSSSTPGFVERVSPEIALVSAGWRNRFRQPSPEVVERYRRHGATVVRTDLHGAIRVVLPGLPGAEMPVRTEAARRRYWSDRLDAVP